MVRWQVVLLIESEKAPTDVGDGVIWTGSEIVSATDLQAFSARIATCFPPLGFTASDNGQITNWNWLDLMIVSQIHLSNWKERFPLTGHQ